MPTRLAVGAIAGTGELKMSAELKHNIHITLCTIIGWIRSSGPFFFKYRGKSYIGDTLSAAKVTSAV